MAAVHLNIPYQPAFDNAGLPIDTGGKLELYEPGTSTPKIAYSDAGKTTSLGSTITIDSSGRTSVPVYFDGKYKVEIYDYVNDAYVLLDTVDNFGIAQQVTAVSTEGLGIFNGSFEVDSDSDDVPDYWTATDSGTVISLESSGAHHGGVYLKFTSTSGGSDYLTSDYYPINAEQRVAVSFSLKVSNASANPQIKVLWYDNAQSLLSTTTVFDGDTNALSTAWDSYKYLTADAPTSATYYRVQLIGNTGGIGYDVCFDGLAVDILFDVAYPAPFVPYGLRLSNDTVDANHDIDISPGAVRNHDNTYDLILTSALDKQFDAAWAVGTDAGGDDGSGLPADGIYYVYVIGDSSTGRVDVIGSQNSSSPALPSGWDKYRLIGCIWTDNVSNFVGLQHVGGERFDNIADDGVLDVEDTAVIINEWNTATLTVPPYSTAIVFVKLSTTASWSNNLGAGLRHPDSSATNGVFWVNPKDATQVDDLRFTAQVPVDENSQMQYAVLSGDLPVCNVDIYTIGCLMHTRDNPI